MKYRSLFSQLRLHPLLSFFFMLIGLSLFGGGMASANYSSLGQIKYPVNQYGAFQENVNLNAGANSGESGAGAHVPDTWFKLYTNALNGASRAVSVYIVPVTSDPGNCTNYSILSQVETLNPDGSLAGGVVATQDQPIPSCGVRFNITVPNDAWTPSSLGGEGGWYFTLLHLSIDDPGNSHSAFLNVDTTASYPDTRIGLQNQAYTTIFPRVNPNYQYNGDYTITQQFAPTCGSPSDSTDRLHWGDDDWGTLTQSNPNMRIDVTQTNRFTGQQYTYPLAYNGGGLTGFSGSGEKYWAPPGGWSSANTYTVQFSHVDGGNGIWLSLPFDEGNAYAPCQPPVAPPPTCSTVTETDPGNYGGNPDLHSATLVNVTDSQGGVEVQRSMYSPYTSANFAFAGDPYPRQNYAFLKTGASESWTYTPHGASITLYTIREIHNVSTVNQRVYGGIIPPNGWGYFTNESGHDGTVNCYNAVCTNLTVVGNVPNGPGNGVEAGQPFHVDATIANTGPGDLPASLNGSPLQVDPGSWNNSSSNPGFGNTSTGGIPHGQSVVVQLSLGAPGGVANDTVNAHPAYSGEFAFGPGSDCSASVKVYQHFHLSANANTSFTGDAENPTAVNSTTSVTNNSGSPPVQASDTSTLFFTPSQTNSQINLPPSPYSDTADYGTKNPEWSNTYSIPQTRLGLSQVTAGDTYCTEINISYTDGWVGPGGPTDYADTSGGGTYPSPPSCVVVVNKPFFKVYGSGVSAGGTFSSASTTPDGLLADWNNDSGLNPSPADYNYGGGSELSNRSSGSIVGYASAQQNSGDLRPAPDLNYANTTPADSITSDPYTPVTGGKYNSTLPNLLSETGAGPPIGWANQANPTSGNYTAGSTTSQQNVVLSSPSTPTTINPGQNVSLNVYGNVYIDGNVLYSGANSSGWNISNVPSFTLSVTGGNIYIDPSVGELDGLFIAVPSGGNGGKIYTCGQDIGNIYSPMNESSLYGSCHEQLSVYGSFEAQQVNLMRTYGTLRDETPIGAGSITIPTSTPGQQSGIVWSENNDLNSDPTVKCTWVHEDSPGWGDNHICLPASSPYDFWWETGAPYTVTNKNCQYIDDSNNPYRPNLEDTWKDDILCSNLPNFWYEYGYPPAGSVTLGTHIDAISSQPQSSYVSSYSNSAPNRHSGTGSYCTLMYEDSDNTATSSDPNAPKAWETTYICEPIAAATTGSKTVAIAAHPPIPLYCSNNGGTTSARPTCAAEVFDYSPEASLSSPPTVPVQNNANSPTAIYNLPPVL